MDFWRYSISGNSWQNLADAPDIVDWGGALTFDGSNTIYALRGAGNNSFWKYTISTGAWSSLADTPANVNDGGALSYNSGFVYGFRGDGQKDFWRYSVSGDSWSSMASAPSNVNQGGALVSLDGARALRDRAAQAGRSRVGWSDPPSNGGGLVRPWLHRDAGHADWVEWGVRAGH